MTKLKVRLLRDIEGYGKQGEIVETIDLPTLHVANANRPTGFYVHIDEYELVDQSEEIERLNKRLDSMYSAGAQQAAAMAHQSMQAMDEWIAGGCGNRRAAVEPSSAPAAAGHFSVEDSTSVRESSSPATVGAGPPTKPTATDLIRMGANPFSIPPDWDSNEEAK